MTAVNENVTQNGDDAPKTPMGLKILVVVLGIAIVVMLMLIIWKVLAGDTKKDVPVVAPVAQIVASPNITNADISVVRPAGSELVSSEVSGTEIILHFKTSEMDWIVTVNRQTGKESRLTIPR